ncbi:hypothetical protein LSH36_10g02006, partial [Paralvinella palmiformis]
TTGVYMTDGETMETRGDCSSGSSLLLEDSVFFNLGSEQDDEQGQEKPSLLDLVISSKEELVSDITYLEPLGKSDHLCLSFNINTKPETINNSQQRYRMDKGDYTGLEDIIYMIIEETFKDQYDKAVDICIPKYTAKTTKWRRPLWMNDKAINACKKKYWAWKRN